jgi:hypothetical protein
MGAVRAPLAASAIAVAAALALAGGAGASHGDDNPCKKSQAATLLCPNLQMQPPSDLWIEEVDGRRLLHARNSINSRGEGPAELRGRAHGPYTMTARQAIHKRGGGVKIVDTGAWLGWKAIPGQYHYWKFRNAGIFTIWSWSSKGRPIERVRRGPKQYYCLRDLERTWDSPRTPAEWVYPGCSQDHDIDRVTLGTSVGWSDVYPSTYHEQWIDVTGLEGKFGFYQVADPENGLWENSEHDNAGLTVIRLPSGDVVRKRSRVDRPRKGVKPE